MTAAGGAPAGAGGSGAVDLHAHSTASDGSRTPTDLVAVARAAGLAAVALTDHDTVAGIPEAQAAAAEAGLRVVPGVELSAVEGDLETHLLGLHLSRPERIKQGLAGIRGMRRTRAERIVARLNELGVRITFADVLEQAGDAAIGRPHVARALVEHGWATDLRDAFDRYLGNGRPAFVSKDRLTIEDAIAMIHEAGGLAFLAHPGHSGTRARLEALAARGLDGVEVLHPSHSAEDVARLKTLAEYLHLLPTGGSDWHGADEGTRTLGAMRVPAEWLELHEARLAERRATVEP
ncbi:MAG TPA: PHP domain-containing protein [Gemmatimonadaceae bacterium]|nr:PHP domain-containing protein [Gemmatimonadaceae bacterium]